jgi:tetratricopeptide (TPR) repeat protein
MPRQKGPLSKNDLRARVQALYYALPVSPENTRELRGLAWGLLANLLISDYLNRWNEASDDPAGGSLLLQDAEYAVDKALAIDPDFAVAHYAKGLIHRANGDRDGALAEFDAAIARDADFARAYAQKASELINAGQPDDVLRLLQRAIELGPRDASRGMFHWNIGRAHFFAARYDDAIRSLKTAVRQRPNLWHNWLYLASAYALSGKDTQARKTLDGFEAREEFRNPKVTLARVRMYEKANPTTDAFVREGRRKFHEGLLQAGLPQA